VAERIDVRVAVAVARHAHEVEREPDLTVIDTHIVTLRKEMHRLIRIVGSGHLVDRNCHRDAAAGAHEGCGLAHLLESDEVHRAKLVGLAPSTPVLHGFEDRLELLDGHLRRNFAHAGSFLSPCLARLRQLAVSSPSAAGTLPVV
jgi:hypothetical protein